MNNVFYINLKHRTDRKARVENELNTLGWKYERFEAIKLVNGRIGCSMSHLKLLEKAKREDLEYIIIVEDDIKFLNKRLFLNHFNKTLEKHADFDVLLLAGNLVPKYKKLSEYTIQVSHCQTTTGYMVKKHYYDTLISNIKEGIKKLLKEPDKHIFYAIDKWWIQLQKKDKWYFVYPPTVTQADDYSDIEKKHVTYQHLMLDVEKKWLRRK